MAGKAIKKTTVKKSSPKVSGKRSAARTGSTIKMTHIREKAQELGLGVPVGISKTELIRNIQRAEGNFDCFGTVDDYCDQFICYWRSLCLVPKKIN